MADHTIVKLSKTEVAHLKSRSNAIDRLNTKLQVLREKQLFECLKDATETRMTLVKKVQNWVNLLEARIFDPAVIGEMSLDRVISLFKYVGNFSLKLLGQINDVESIFKAYLETNLALEKIKTTRRGPDGAGISDGDAKVLRGEMLRAFVDVVKTNAKEAELKAKAEDGVIVIEPEVSNMPLSKDFETENPTIPELVLEPPPAEDEPDPAKEDK